MFTNKQSLRSFIAFLVTWSFAVLTITGIVLYIVPQGRVAYWVHWGLWGLEKDDWGHVHMMFGGVFILTGVLHLYFNWKPFKKYLAERIRGHVEVSRELAGSLLLSLLVVAASVWEVPPVSWVFDLNEDIKEAWVTSPDLEPPFGHAEEVSLAGLARRLRLDLPKAERALRDAGLDFGGSRDSLEQIARANGITPMAAYALIRGAALPGETPGPGMPLTAEQVEERFSGTGLGRKTIDEAAAAAGTDPAVAKGRLNAAGIDFAPDDSLRAIADRQASSPIDLMKIILEAESGAREPK